MVLVQPRRLVQRGADAPDLPAHQLALLAAFGLTMVPAAQAPTMRGARTSRMRALTRGLGELRAEGEPRPVEQGRAVINRQGVALTVHRDLGLRRAAGGGGGYAAAPSGARAATVAVPVSRLRRFTVMSDDGGMSGTPGLAHEGRGDARVSTGSALRKPETLKDGWFVSASEMAGCACGPPWPATGMPGLPADLLPSLFSKPDNSHGVYC